MCTCGSLLGVGQHALDGSCVGLVNVAGLTKNGKIKRGHAFRSHILTKKTTKLTRGYRQPNYVDKTNAATIKSMLPYA